LETAYSIPLTRRLRKKPLISVPSIIRGGAARNERQGQPVVHGANQTQQAVEGSAQED